MSIDAEPGLFDAPPPVATPAPERLTVGERRRRRHLRMIAVGLHPLGAALHFPLRLHADAPRDADLATPGPRCGSCRFRQTFGHHDRTYPGCTAGAMSETRRAWALGDPVGGPCTGKELTVWTYPRWTHGPGSDVKRYWPACVSYEPAGDDGAPSETVVDPE